MAGLLAVAELAGVRADATAALPDTGAVWRATLTSDGRGGTGQAWAAVASGVLCRLAPGVGLAAGEGLTASRLGPDASWVVTLPHDTDVGLADRLVIGTRTFEVTFVASGRSELVSLRVACRELGDMLVALAASVVLWSDSSSVLWSDGSTVTWAA